MGFSAEVKIAFSHSWPPFFREVQPAFLVRVVSIRTLIEDGKSAYNRGQKVDSGVKSEGCC